MFERLQRRTPAASVPALYDLRPGVVAKHCDEQRNRVGVTAFRRLRDVVEIVAVRFFVPIRSTFASTVGSTLSARPGATALGTVVI